MERAGTIKSMRDRKGRAVFDRSRRAFLPLSAGPEKKWAVDQFEIRCFTRLTNAFSKKLENHIHALAIYFMHYNFVRIHQTLRITPAMAAGFSDTLWSLDDMVRVVDEWETTRHIAATENVEGIK